MTYGLIGFLAGAAFVAGLAAGLLRRYRELQLAVKVHHLFWNELASQGHELTVDEIQLLEMSTKVLRGQYGALWRGLRLYRLQPEAMLEAAKRRLARQAG